MEQLNKCYDFLTVCRPDVKPELLVQVGYSPVVIGPHVGQLSDCRPHCEAAVAVLRRLVWPWPEDPPATAGASSADTSADSTSFPSSLHTQLMLIYMYCLLGGKKCARIFIVGDGGDMWGGGLTDLCPLPLPPSSFSGRMEPITSPTTVCLLSWLRPSLLCGEGWGEGGVGWTVTDNHCSCMLNNETFKYSNLGIY